jgi:hypothetical protein
VNSPSKRPDPVFFLDRSLGKNRVATALRQAGATVHIHDDHFPPDAKPTLFMTVRREIAEPRRETGAWSPEAPIRTRAVR